MYLSYEEIKDFLYTRKFDNSIANLKKKYCGKKILLYGAGLFSRVILDSYSLEDLNIIAISDLKFKEEGEFYNFKSIPPQKIKDLSPDLILISTYKDSEIKSSLNKNYPELRKINKIGIIQRTLNDKIHALKELFT